MPVKERIWKITILHVAASSAIYSLYTSSLVFGKFFKNLLGTNLGLVVYGRPHSMYIVFVNSFREEKFVTALSFTSAKNF